MPASVSEGPVVTLRGGLCVPTGALALLWALEERGITVRLDADGEHLWVVPGDKLTAADRFAIGAYKEHLVALISYCDGRVQ